MVVLVAMALAVVVVAIEMEVVEICMSVKGRELQRGTT